MLTRNLISFLYRYVVTTLLVGAALFRSTFASSLYLFGFVAMVLVRPSVYRPRSKTLSMVVLGLVVASSALILLTELLFGGLALFDQLPRDEDHQQIIHNAIGFYWNDVTPLQYVQMTVPDTLVFLSAVLLLGAMLGCPFETPLVISSDKELKELSKKLDEPISKDRTVKMTARSIDWDESLTRYLHGYIQLVLCYAAGILYPSVLTFCYLLGSLLAVLAVAFGASIYWLELVTWPLILIFTIANVIYLYLSQFQYGGVEIALNWLTGPGRSGLWFFDDFTFAEIAPVVTEFFVLLLILLLAGYRANSILDYRAKRKLLHARAIPLENAGLSDSDGEGQSTSSYQQSSPRVQREDPPPTRVHAEPEDFVRVARFVKTYGWPMTFLAYLCACVSTPSLPQAVVLFVVMFGTSCVPPRVLRKVLPLLLVYSTAFIIAQVIYNLGFDFPETDILINMGLIYYHSYMAAIGIQCIPVLFLAAYWRFSVYYKRVKAAKKAAKARRNSVVSGGESSDGEDELIQVNLKRNSAHKRISKMRKTAEREKRHEQLLNEENSYWRLRILVWMEVTVDRVQYFASLGWQIFLKNSYYFTLLALLLCSLVSANLFNFGYLAFFVIFLLSRKIALMFWIVLVLYTECVIMVIFVWQVTWTEPYDSGTVANWFGLQHYDYLVVGLFIPLAIFVFSLAQLALIRVFKKRLELQGLHLRDSSVKAAQFDSTDLELGPLSRMTLNTVELCVDKFSLPLCYLIFYLVGMTAHYDLFSVYYLIVVYLCMILHELFDDARAIIAPFWAVIVISSGTILVAIYFFQFDSIAEWVQSIYPDSVNQYLTLADIGLNLDESSWEAYLSLLGTSCIFFMSVLQLRAFVLQKNWTASNRDGYQEIPDSAEQNPEEIAEMDHRANWTDVPRVKQFLHFLKRAVVLHADKLTFLISFAAVIVSVSLLNDLLILLIIVGLILPHNLDSIGLIVILFSQAITLFVYATQFGGYIYFLEHYLFGDNQTLTEEWLTWIGAPYTDNVFRDTLAYNLLIVALVLERMGRRWENDPDIKCLRTEHKEPCPLFLVTKTELRDAREAFNIDSDQTVISRKNLRFFVGLICWYISNCFRKHGIYFFTFCLLITLFLRYNIWSILEIALVGCCLVKPRWILRSSIIWTVLLAYLVVFEYTTYLGAPPNFESSPWSDLSADVLAWFTIGAAYNIKTIYADLLCVLLASYLYKSYHIKKQDPRDSLLKATPRNSVGSFNSESSLVSFDSLHSIRSTSSFTNYHSEDGRDPISEETLEYRVAQAETDEETTELALVALHADEVDPIMKSEKDLKAKKDELIDHIHHHRGAIVEGDKGSIFRITSWRDRVIYMIFRYSIHFIMLFMFMAATAQANLLSVGYVLFALFFLYKDTLLYKRKNEIWRWGRVYNFAVMVLIILYQIPYVPNCIPACSPTPCTECDPYALQPIVGLYKFTDARHVFSPDGILFDLIIFLLMSFQAVIFDTVLFQRVANHIFEERNVAVYRAKLRYLQFLKKEEMAIQTVKEEKKRRAARLEKIHRYREEKQYLLSSSKVGLERGVAGDDVGDSPAVEVTEARRPLLGVPERDESHEAYSEPSVLPDSDEEVMPEEPEFAPLAKESEVEKEIADLFSTIEDLKDIDNMSDISDDNSSIASDDLLTKREKLARLWATAKEYFDRFSQVIYRRFVQYLYSQTFQRPDPSQTKFQVCCRGAYHFALNQSHILCYVTFILNNMVYANLLSLVYPTAAFLYALMESPVPSRVFWRFCILYTYMVIFLKFLFQISVFGVCYSSSDWYFWGLEPFISSNDYPFCSQAYYDSTVIIRNLPELTGIIKASVFFAAEIGMDLLVLFALLLHRNVSKKSGLWIYLTTRHELAYTRFAASQETKKKLAEEKKEKKKRYDDRVQQAKARKEEERRRFKSERKRLRDPIALQPTEEEEHESDPVDHTSSQDPQVNPLVEPIKVPPPVDPEESSEPSIHEEPVAPKDVPPLADGDKESSEATSSESELNVTATATPSLWERGKGHLHFYYHRVLSHKATAKDYYVTIVTVEVLAFFFMLLFQNSFTYNPPEEYSFILLESRIPTSFFLLLLIQFLLIVIDRIIYLFRSLLAKVILQYVTVIYYTLLLFFILPQGQGEEFDEQPVLLIFYGMQCIYWWFSALQICEGYPVDIQKRWITKRYNMIHRYLFQVYLLIPFLFELRSMLDWAVFDTTLNFFQWMKLEDIYRNLFKVKCQRVAEGKQDWYQKQSFLMKNLVGFAAFVGLIVLLWFPLFLLSSANPTNQPNPVISATFEVGVEGFVPFYHENQDQGLHTATEEEFDTIRKNFPSVQGDQVEDTQVIDMHIYSDEVWVMTPPSQRNLERTLLATNELYLTFRYTFRRAQPPGSEVLVGETSVTLDHEQRQQLADIISGSNETERVVIPKIIPRVFKLALSGPVTTPDSSSNNLDVVLSLNRTVVTETYPTGDVEVVRPYWYMYNHNTSQNYVDDADTIQLRPQLVVVSAQLPSFLSASLAASGIIGLYVTIVLAVGRFLRMGVSDLQYNIIFEDLPEPIDLITMCEDIFMAREDGDMKLERDLYNELIQLYRSPESLIAVTKRKIPPPPGWGTSTL